MEQLDISTVISNNVKGYLNPKNKIYRLTLAQVTITPPDEYADIDDYVYKLDTQVISKVIEVIDYKVIDDLIVTGICPRDVKEMYEKCACMSKGMFDGLIKHRKISLDDDFDIILLDYKQLA
jgi:hypothetical protein